MEKKINLDSAIWQWTLLIVLAAIWGSSFILMKKGLQSYTNNQVAAFRLFFSFIFMLPVIIKRFKRFKLKFLKSILIVAFIGNAIPAFLYTKAQTNIESSVAGMLNSLVPFFALIIGLVFYKNKTKFSNIIGVLLGFIGAAGLILKNAEISLTGSIFYALLIVLATACYGTSVNEIKSNLPDLDGITLAALIFLFIGPISGVYLLFSDFSNTPNTPDYIQNLGFVVMLALFSSVIAVTIFNILIKYTSALFGASVTYIIPIFAILWGVLDGEEIVPLQLLWMGVIMLGVYLVNKK